MTEFEKDLRDLLNRHSRENASDTPDWILAEFLQNCLLAFDNATQDRARWLGIKARP